MPATRARRGPRLPANPRKASPFLRTFMPITDLVEQVDGLLSRKDDQRLKSALARLSPQEIAQIINSLPHGKRKVFAHLPPERQSEVAVVLTEADKDYIFPRLTELSLSRFLHFNEEDDATDILQHLPEHQRPKVLRHMKEDKRRKIEKLLTFGAETAGGLMDLSFLSVQPSMTMQEVRAAVQEYGRVHKQIPIVVTVDATKGVIGTISPRDLLVTPGTQHASHVTKPVVATLHSTDREQVLSLITKAQSEVICVISDHGQLLGVIQIRDLLRVAEAEATEDAYRMAAVFPIETDYLRGNFATVWRNRAVWLSVLFIAELFTFTALASFESSIATVTALALFVPLCISTGGNSGSQAATLITRAMALGQVTPRDWWRVLRHELKMGLALGATLGAVGFVRAFLTPADILGRAQRWDLALVIGASVALICLWGTMVGSLLPLAFRRLGLDPAYASSPFVATFVDVTGIIIYFSIANALILA